MPTPAKIVCMVPVVRCTCNPNGTRRSITSWICSSVALSCMATIMIVAMQERATEEQIQDVIERLVPLGLHVHRTTGTIQTILAGVGMPAHFDHKEFEVLAGVSEVVRISSPYKLAGRSF